MPASPFADRIFNRVTVLVGALTAIVALSSGAAALVFALWPGLEPADPPEKLTATIGKLAVEPNVTFGGYLARVGALDEYRALRSALLGSVSTGTIQRGARGPVVVTLQRLLLQQGVYRGSANGLFERSTEDAVKAFQRQTGVTPDGLVGPQTIQQLVRANPTSFAKPGMVLYVEIKVEGFRVREFGPLQANLYDAERGTRVRDPGVVPIADLLRPVVSEEQADAVFRLGEITQSRARVRPAAPIDQRGKLLWVASPRRAGAFFVRVELYDVDGELVHFADTKTFRIPAGAT